MKTFTTDSFEKIRAWIVADSFSLFKRRGIVSSGSERGFYGQNEMQLIPKEKSMLK